MRFIKEGIHIFTAFQFLQFLLTLWHMHFLRGRHKAKSQGRNKIPVSHLILLRFSHAAQLIQRSLGDGSVPLAHALNQLQLQRLNAVSYTHLDVYKRQLIGYALYTGKRISYRQNLPALLQKLRKERKRMIFHVFQIWQHDDGIAHLSNPHSATFHFAHPLQDQLIAKDVYKRQSLLCAKFDFSRILLLQSTAMLFLQKEGTPQGSPAQCLPYSKCQHAQGRNKFLWF